MWKFPTGSVDEVCRLNFTVSLINKIVGFVLIMNFALLFFSITRVRMYVQLQSEK